MLGVSQKGKPYVSLLCGNELSFPVLIPVFFKLVHIGRCLYARDPRGETFACVVLMLALVAAFVENHVCAEKCSLRVELPGETIEPESCVCVAGDSEGVDRAGLVLKRANDAYGEYRVGLSQA